MDKKFETLPKEFLERMKNQLGENYENYLKVFQDSAIRGLRINTKRINVSDFLERSKLSLEKIEFADDGFYFLSDEKIGNELEHLTGQIYFQEPSSMIAVVSSQIESDKRPLKILDLCASPGGKTSQIVCRVSDDSVIYSNEIIKSRANVLFSNIERQGFQNVVVMNEKPENLHCFDGYFDYVFVDAPCSGEGMFRKNSETISQWSENNVRFCSERQKEILMHAEKLVKNGGKLIYSTCTFSNEEDEQIVCWLIDCFNFKLADVPQSIKNVTVSSGLKVKNGQFARKFYPFHARGEGQFVAVLEKTGSIEENVFSTHGKHNIKLASRTDLKIIEQFMQKNLKEIPIQRIIQVGENYFLTPTAFDETQQNMLDNLKFISIGVKLGAIQKNRFEPSHTFFMAYPSLFKIQIELDHEELERYLHGEELSKKIEADGFAIVTCDGFPIGGVKVVGNRLKNLYPKGLRI